ncbi:hypothetical protein MPTK1_3g23870 [Marchantia polymorpha subsp. ruderalis]|uniref:YbaK/aminoacyl-tRNA synthetase-associated domain-containing protein n=2 Tax=Marchantia polymorpha TaxID=3197 RepID=A0AAF6B452_MARPO|nr:hypothetical protein MARPO_0121s0036 [Marchantia polymorpha]BBN06786.1 hypothetical protein Mp_3g23870 [Marchantia polymorpha subsp. ruderalis]|eukprot:PTQ30689.1 hypothetical protein MARPO_0121s0036 [Marchantia polymorpha]
MVIEDEIRELKCRQEALLERVSCLSLRLCTNELATLESRQTSILSQLSAVQERLDSSASGGGNVRGVSACDDDQGLEAGRDGEFSHGKGSAFSRPGGFGLGSERKGDRSEVEERLSELLGSAGATFSFKRVPSDYYSRSYEQRRDLLGAASVDHLCKSIVMVNTQALESITDCSDRKNSKYYLIVIQYTARLNAEKVKQFVYSLNDGKVPKKKFNLRLAPEEESNKLTGFEHNAVTPFGMVTDIPVILSDAIVRLQPEYFWLGGGEVDLKLGLRTEDFIRILSPFIVDCIY